MRSILLARHRGGAGVLRDDRQPSRPTRSAGPQTQYDQLLAGKVAGQPVSCLPTYQHDDMIVIDEQTVAFREAAAESTSTHMQRRLRRPRLRRYALVTRTFGSRQLCRGDIAPVVSGSSSAFTVGSCSVRRLRALHAAAARLSAYCA